MHFSALDYDYMAVLYHGQDAGSSTNSFIVPSGEAVPGAVLRFYAYGSHDVLITAIVTSASL